MTRGEAVNWLINITADIGKAEHRELWHYEQVLSEIREMLESESERKKGKWIVHTTYLEHDCTIQYEVCSQCGKPKPRKLFDNDFSYEVNYCVACGADMRGET